MRVLESRWHRMLAGYADLVKLCAVTLLFSLGVVTIPLALATAYDGVRQLRTVGDLPALRASASALWRPATVTGLPPLGLAVTSAWAAVFVASPFLTSAALALAAIAMVVLVRSAATVSCVPHADRSTAWHLVLRDLTVHPTATVGLVLPWVAVTYVLLVAPVAVTVPVWCVALSLPPMLGVALTERAARSHPPQTASTPTERSIP